MELPQLKKLIGYHLLYYSYNRDKMVNFRPEGDFVSESNKDKNAGMYYKFRTRSMNEVTKEIEPSTGKHITVYHLERFLPVFSHRFFGTKGIDPVYNYEYFYNNSKWTGDKGFNVSNASVKDYEIITDNGYIYTVDKVIEPLETIFTELKNREKYSEFFNLYDSYSNYEYDKTLSDDYGKSIGIDSLYLHKHGSFLPPIAMEWPVSSFQDIKTLSSVSYSVFAISNQAMNSFFNNFWELGEYESLYDVDPLVIEYLLNQYVYSGSIVFPEEIINKKIKNRYGVVYDFNPNEISDKAMCVNGSFYGIDHLDTPPLFASVAGPAFRNKYNAAFLYAMDGSGLLGSYLSPDIKFNMLIPNDTQMSEGGGIYLKSYQTGNVLQEETEDGWANTSSSKMQSVVNMHTVSATDGNELKTTGYKVYSTQIPFNYWFVKDGTITNNALFNKIIEPEYIGSPFVAFSEITNNGKSWTNGKVYKYDNEQLLFEEEKSDGLEHALAVCNDQRYPYFAFVQLLKKANMVLGTNINGLQDGRFIVFIPTNEAIKDALSKNLIPGVKNGVISSDGTFNASSIDAVTLLNYLNTYFLRSTENIVSAYPYIGSTMKSATYTTANLGKLEYIEKSNGLSIKLTNKNEVNVISDYNYFPFAYHDGCFHLLESIL